MVERKSMHSSFLYLDFMKKVIEVGSNIREYLMCYFVLETDLTSYDKF